MAIASTAGTATTGSRDAAATDTITGYDGNDTVYAGVGAVAGRGRCAERRARASTSSATSGALNGVTVNLATGDGGGADRIGERTNPAVAGSFVLDNDGFSSFENLEGSHPGRQPHRRQLNTIGATTSSTAVGGDDTLIGGAGADATDRRRAAGGSDWADYSSSSGAVTVSLVAGAVGSGGDAEGDTLNTIENLRGSDRTDHAHRRRRRQCHRPGHIAVERSGRTPRSTRSSAAPAPTRSISTIPTTTTASGWSAGSTDRPAAATSGATTPTDTSILDGVDFSGIEKLVVVGTFKGDTIFGGEDDDRLYAGGGDDTVFGGIGSD